jgi:nucleoside-diphosphate-sugar epimerase
MELYFSPEQKQRKVFILGATGFIGAAVTKRLAALGFVNIHGLYRDADKLESAFPATDTSAITFLEGDMSALAILREGISDAHIVLNAAGVQGGEDTNAYWLGNVTAPKAIVELMDESGAVAHYIHITSAQVFGFSADEKNETCPLVVSDPNYTGSKVEIHSWLRAEMRGQRPFPITVIAPSIVWGPGDRVYLPSIKQMLLAGQLGIFEGAEALDFVHIDDLVTAILLCFYNEASYNQEYIINGPAPISFEEYATAVARFLNVPPPTAIWPRSDTPGLVELTLSKLSRVSIAKAKEELGYRPEVDLDTGIGTIEDYVLQL